MTPEEKNLLIKSVKLSEENNKILKGIRRSARISSFLRFVYWLIILGSVLGAYYFIQPYVDAAVKSYNEMKDKINNTENTTTKLPDLPDWLSKK